VIQPYEAEFVPGTDRSDLNRLVLAVARREDGSFDGVFAALSGPVRALALALVRDPAQADEIAQDVLTEIWRTAGRYDPGRGSAVSWALMITRRRAIDRIRSVVADARRERRTAGVLVPWDELGERADDLSDREQLRTCLDLLPGAQREAVMLAFYGGYSYADVAVLLDLPAGTVKTRMRAALSRLRDCMQDGPEDPPRVVPPRVSDPSLGCPR
jgi:RNA polymerase sigma-70 factor (ECF subfamily)